MEIWYGFLFHDLLAWLPKLCLHLTYQLNAPQSSDGWSVLLDITSEFLLFFVKWHMQNDLSSTIYCYKSKIFFIMINLFTLWHLKSRYQNDHVQHNFFLKKQAVKYNIWPHIIVHFLLQRIKFIVSCKAFFLKKIINILTSP